MIHLHKNISKFLFELGVKKRNPSLFRHLKKLNKSQYYSFEALKELQEERLKDIIQFAVTNSSFYSDYWKDWKDQIIQDFSISLVQELPLISKFQLIQNNKDIHTSSKLFKKRFFCETSGTSGQVLTFMRDENWDSFNRASIFRGYSWHNVYPWEFNLYFWGYNTDFKRRLKVRFFDFLVNRYRLFDYDEKALKKIGNKIKKARYVEGYSSMIYELANSSEKLSLDTRNLKMIKGTSEKIYEHYQDKVTQVFGKRMISEYGAAESGIIAFECEAGNMHINMEGVYVEVDNNNEIIVTNLMSYSFPIIRYKLGDVIQLSDEKCTCGREHPIIKEVTGRVGKKIHGLKNKYPSLTLYYIFKNLYFEHDIKLNYQAHQDEPGKLNIWIKEKLTERKQKILFAECKKYFKEDVSIKILHRLNFRESQGKLRDFISLIE